MPIPSDPTSTPSTPSRLSADAVLEFELTHWSRHPPVSPTVKDAEIWKEFEVLPVRYYQKLNMLLDDPAPLPRYIP